MAGRSKKRPVTTDDTPTSGAAGRVSVVNYSQTLASGSFFSSVKPQFGGRAICLNSLLEKSHKNRALSLFSCPVT
jgi:hypothetical protein